MTRDYRTRDYGDDVCLSCNDARRETMGRGATPTCPEVSRLVVSRQQIIQTKQLPS